MGVRGEPSGFPHQLNAKPLVLGPLCLLTLAFNADEGWSRDETHDIGFELLDMSQEGRVLGTSARGSLNEPRATHATDLLRGRS